MKELVHEDAFELAHLIHAKSLSCREVMQAHLQRIREVNPKVNAIVTLLDEEEALA